MSFPSNLGVGPPQGGAGQDPYVRAVGATRRRADRL